MLNVDARPPKDTSREHLWLKTNILDAKGLTKAFDEFRPDYLIHLAARTNLLEKRDLRGYAANIAGVENTIRAAASVGTLRRAIFASSRMVCKIGYVPLSETDYCPPNLYGRSKVLTETIVRSQGTGFEWLIVRPTSIWGPWFDIPYKTFFCAIAQRRYVHPGKHDPEKSFGFVGNAVYQLNQLLTTRHPSILGRTIYQCDYPPLKLRAWAELIRSSMGVSRIHTLPLLPLRIAALLGDVMEAAGVRAPLSSFRLTNLIAPMVYPTDLLEEICGPLPYSVEIGVRMTVDWLRKC